MTDLSLFIDVLLKQAEDISFITRYIHDLGN